MIESGVINIYKEKGYTSHDVAAIVRKTLNRVKTGHTGTLDPQAEGVLPVCVGQATRLAGRLTADDKTYRAEVLLGVTTDTGDQTGQILSTRPVAYAPEVIAGAVQSFVGEYDQQPPMYSAVKVNGKKLYELARKGITVERAARRVKIDRLEITAFCPERNAFMIEVDCSKGTYIRSLCADIGDALGCGACMGDLIRMRSGIFLVADAVRLDDFKQAVSEGRLKDYLLSADQVLPHAHAFLKEEGVRRAVNGNPVPLDFIKNADKLPELPVWLYDGERLIGLFTVVHSDGETDHLRPEVMLI